MSSTQFPWQATLSRLRGTLPTLKNAIFGFVLGRFEKKIFHAALLTVLLVTTVKEFAAWKYISVMIREVVASVQADVLPRLSAQGIPAAAGGHNVAALLIDDDLFASKEGFGHRIPLPSDRVLAFLTATWAALPKRPLLVIDFDLAPRVGEDQGKRRDLDNWLADHADRLVLVEPAWATRSAETLGHQISWTQRMCRIAPVGSPLDGKPAVIAQSTLASRFGFVQDSQQLSGEHQPRWDIARATADQIGPSRRHRNPLCDRLRGEPRAPSVPQPDPMQSLKLQLHLGRELQRSGALQIAPQPVSTRDGRRDVLLRNEYLREHDDCSPKRFEDLGHLACLAAAEVVLIGGSWSFGAGDRHDTFVGEMDGAAIHTAWIQSWLKPAVPLNKGVEAVLDIAVMEGVLYPILSFLFFHMRRRSTAHSRRLDVADHIGPRAEHATPVLPRLVRPTFGLDVSVTVGCLFLAFATVAATTFALILTDGLLRWQFDRALSLDGTITALLLWCAMALGGVIKQKHRRGIHAVRSAATLGVICLLVSATALGAGLLVSRTLVIGLAAVTIVLMIGAAFLPRPGLARSQSHGDSPRTLDDRWKHLLARASRLREAFAESISFSFRPSLPRRRGLSGVRQVVQRIGEPVGALLWVSVFGYGIYSLIRSAIWEPFVLAILGG